MYVDLLCNRDTHLHCMSCIWVTARMAYLSHLLFKGCINFPTHTNNTYTCYMFDVNINLNAYLSIQIGITGQISLGTMNAVLMYLTLPWPSPSVRGNHVQCPCITCFIAQMGHAKWAHQDTLGGHGLTSMGMKSWLWCPTHQGHVCRQYIGLLPFGQVPECELLRVHPCCLGPSGTFTIPPHG